MKCACCGKQIQGRKIIIEDGCICEGCLETLYHPVAVNCIKYTGRKLRKVKHAFNISGLPPKEDVIFQSPDGLLLICRGYIYLEGSTIQNNDIRNYEIKCGPSSVRGGDEKQKVSIRFKAGGITVTKVVFSCVSKDKIDMEDLQLHPSSQTRKIYPGKREINVT